MSTWVVSKADMDAFLTIALRWTEQGDVFALPEPARSLLHVTADNASRVGRTLWRANHDRFNYYGPREALDEQQLAELEAELGDDLVTMPDYEFEAFPGTPRPETAVRRAQYYRYQTADDYWSTPEEWTAGTGPFEALFTTAMEWYGLVLLGLADGGAMPRSIDELEVPDLEGREAYEASGWYLEETDRDLFQRVG